MSFEDQVVFITGGSAGIGSHLAREFLNSGAKVYVTGKNLAKLEKFQDSLSGEMRDRAQALNYSVDDLVKTKEAFQTVFKREKKLDVLVNNAGIFLDRLLPMYSEDDFRSVIQVNLLGSLFHMQQASRLMARGKYGRIINMSSIIGLEGFEGQTAYSAAKAGIIGATKSAAKELAENGITVNAIAPGFIETDMTENVANKEDILKSIPVGRFGKTTDVVNIALFLASKNSSYITGEVFKVTGGMRI